MSDATCELAQGALSKSLPFVLKIVGRLWFVPQSLLRWATGVPGGAAACDEVARGRAFAGLVIGDRNGHGWEQGRVVVQKCEFCEVSDSP